MSKNMKVGLEIKAGTNGVEQIIDLSKAIKQTGIEADHLTKEGMELAETFNKIEREKGLVDNFKCLKKESVDVANQLEQQQQKIAGLAKAMQAFDKPTKAMVSEFEKAKREAKILSDRKKQLNETPHKSRKAIYVYPRGYYSNHERFR